MFVSLPHSLSVERGAVARLFNRNEVEGCGPPDRQVPPRVNTPSVPTR
jgi:hypothetical protein